MYSEDKKTVCNLSVSSLVLQQMNDDCVNSNQHQDVQEEDIGTCCGCFPMETGVKIMAGLEIACALLLFISIVGGNLNYFGLAIFVAQAVMANVGVWKRHNLCLVAWEVMKIMSALGFIQAVVWCVLFDRYGNKQGIPDDTMVAIEQQGALQFGAMCVAFCFLSVYFAYVVEKWRVSIKKVVSPAEAV